REVAASTPGASIQLQLPDSLPPVRADAVVLRRILENLASNAVDALAGTTGSIVMGAEPLGDGVDGRVRITVADTGRGMTRQQLDRVFDDFYTTKTAGTGLGLSVVRRLVADLGGSVKVETAPGQGSTFMLEIPIA
ncbi:MAG TPA: ATP-binding protein, partial [Gemmatimonadaceae bacterium]|nr:ATP-binding protein [Gemmatimonadaceae bacterium]